MKCHAGTGETKTRWQQAATKAGHATHLRWCTTRKWCSSLSGRRATYSRQKCMQLTTESIQKGGRQEKVTNTK